MSTNHGPADGADRPAEYFSFYKFLIIKRYKFIDDFCSLKYVSVGTVQSKIMDLKLRNFYNKKISALYSPLLIKNTINKTLS